MLFVVPLFLVVVGQWFLYDDSQPLGGHLVVFSLNSPVRHHVIISLFASERAQLLSFGQLVFAFHVSVTHFLACHIPRERTLRPAVQCRSQVGEVLGLTSSHHVVVRRVVDVFLWLLLVECVEREGHVL